MKAAILAVIVAIPLFAQNPPVVFYPIASIAALPSSCRGSIGWVVASTAVSGAGDAYTCVGGVPTLTATGGGGAISGGNVNAYTVSRTESSSDCRNLQTYNGSSLTLTLPSPPVSGSCPTLVFNLNASTLTISPAAGATLTGPSTLAALSGSSVQGMSIWTDGVNYFSSQGQQGPTGPTGPAGANSCTTTITTGTSATLSTCYTVNEEATAATGVVYTLPTATSGLQFCITNGNNGSAANTGTLELATSASGQFIVFTDGTLSASGGNLTSAGAARDSGCVAGIDSTHWMWYPNSGTWTKH